MGSKGGGVRSFGKWGMGVLVFLLYIVLIAVGLAAGDFTVIGMITMAGVLLLASFIASAVVTAITPQKDKVWQYWAIIFTSVVLVAVVYVIIGAVLVALGIPVFTPTI